MRLHSGRSDTSDLFLICQQTAACAFRCFHFHHCHKGGISADTVILSVSGYHASVKSAVTCLSCRNNLQFCWKEILFLYIVFLFEDAKNVGFHRFFLLLICTLIERSASDQNVKVFSLDNLSSFFLQLFACKMDQKVCDVYNRIIFIFTDNHINYASVFFDNHTMDCKWNCHPLVFLDTSVVVRIKICQICIFI